MSDEYGHADSPGHGSGGSHHPGEETDLGFAVLTVSTSRANGDRASDPGGDALCEAIREAGFEVVARDLVADVFSEIRTAVASFCADPAVDAVVTTGGTGVSPDDVTVGAVSRLFDTDLPGFGETFRRESYAEIDHRAMASRATGGLVSGTPVFCLPGSVGAVETGAELVLGLVPHLVAVAE